MYRLYYQTLSLVGKIKYKKTVFDHIVDLQDTVYRWQKDYPEYEMIVLHIEKLKPFCNIILYETEEKYPKKITISEKPYFDQEYNI